MNFSRTASLLALIVFSSAVLSASTLGEIYTYTGDPYTFIQNQDPQYPPYSNAEFITFSAILPSALAHNLNNADVTSSVTSWTLNDGSYTEDPSVASLLGLEFNTDSQGNITGWFLETMSVMPDYTQVDMTRTIGIVLDEAQTQVKVGGNGVYTNTAQNSNAQGTWTAAVVTPEPSTWGSAAIGGVLLLIAARRRSASVRADC